MTFTSSRGTLSTSSRRCPPSAAWPGTSGSNSTTQGRRSRCRVTSAPHRPRSPIHPPPGLTPLWPPVCDPRGTARTVVWPRLRNRSSRGQPRLPKSPSRLRHSPPNLLTRPKHTRVPVFPWNQSTRDVHHQKSPPFRKAEAKRQSFTNDVSNCPLGGDSVKDLCSCSNRKSFYCSLHLLLSDPFFSRTKSAVKVGRCDFFLFNCLFDSTYTWTHLKGVGGRGGLLFKIVYFLCVNPLQGSAVSFFWQYDFVEDGRLWQRHMCRWKNPLHTSYFWNHRSDFIPPHLFSFFQYRLIRTKCIHRMQWLCRKDTLLFESKARHSFPGSFITRNHGRTKIRRLLFGKTNQCKNWTFLFGSNRGALLVSFISCRSFFKCYFIQHCFFLLFLVFLIFYLFS